MTRTTASDDETPGQPPVHADLPIALLRQAFESSQIAVVISVDRGHAVERIYVNDAVSRLTGYSREELLRAPGLSFTPPPTREVVERIRAARLAGEPVPVSFEAEVVTRDGRTVPITVSLATATLDGAPATVAFIQDCTAAREAQAALAASEERFRLLAEAAPDTIVVIADGGIVYANPNAVRVLGFDNAEEVLALPLRDLVVPEDVPAMIDRVRAVLHGERIPPREYRGRRKDGSVVVMEISSVATRYGGRPAVVGFGRDVTERKAILQRTIDRDRLAAVGTLAAGVAHEINNPLSCALLNIQMLRARAAGSGAGASAEAQLLDDAEEGLERVRRIVQDLLSLARPSDDVNESVDVAQVVRSTVRLARTTANAAARIDADVDGLPPVRTNGARLGQVLLNVLVNALQAVEDRPDPRVRIRGRADSRTLRLEVRDNGPGIPADVLGRVFEPFFTTKPPGRGTGLGLSVSRSIMASLGGTLDITSSEGAGTRVWLTMPLRPAEARPGKPVRGRILVVDDDVHVATSLAALLQESHDPVMCHAPEAAFDLIEREPEWDVVLCDVRMPRMSGPELLERVARLGTGVDRRFVFLTGGVLSPNDARIVAEHRSRVLAKPVDVPELLRVLEEAVARRRAATVG